MTNRFFFRDMFWVCLPRNAQYSISQSCVVQQYGDCVFVLLWTSLPLAKRQVRREGGVVVAEISKPSRNGKQNNNKKRNKFCLPVNINNRKKECHSSMGVLPIESFQQRRKGVRRTIGPKRCHTSITISVESDRVAHWGQRICEKECEIQVSIYVYPSGVVTGVVRTALL